MWYNDLIYAPGGKNVEEEMRIGEKDLILPALAVIRRHPGITTSGLISQLEEILHPDGEDMEILANRKDTKFSQKVRNLKSHREINGMGRWTKYRKGRYWITEEGNDYVERHRNTLDYIMENPFSCEKVLGLLRTTGAKKRKVTVLSENMKISEGMSKTVVRIQKKRSGALRNAAMNEYRDGDGHIRCKVCGFDFLEVYGELGKDYIEFHHEEPIFLMAKEGEEKFLKRAVKEVKPVCANCHRMLHRKRRQVLTIEELKRRIEEQKV